MAWRFRKSVRFPGGFHLNISKRGFGYSWGFRGFRTGQDSEGRVFRSFSIPGTGLYNRRYLGTGNAPSERTGSSWGCGGCIVRVIGFLFILAVVVNLSSSGNATGLIFLVVIAGGYIMWRILRRPEYATSVSEDIDLPDYASLGEEVRAAFEELGAPIKGELRKANVASAYEDVFTMAFIDLICRFAALDGSVLPSEGKVFLDIFKVLHPKAYAGFTAENAVALLDDHLKKHPEAVQFPVQDLLLLKLAKQAGTTYWTRVTDLLYKVARQVALADGPLSEREETELQALQISAIDGATQITDTTHGRPSAPEPRIAVLTNADVINLKKAGLGDELIIDKISTGATTFELDASDLVELHDAGLSDAVIKAMIHAPPHSDTPRVGGDPALSSAHVESLWNTANDLLSTLSGPLKNELRKTRGATAYEAVFTACFMDLICRFAALDGIIRPEEGTVFLEFFKALHPKTYGRMNAQDGVKLIEGHLQRNAASLRQPFKKPLLVKLAEDADQANGTTYAARLGEMMYKVAEQVALADGPLTAQERQELDALGSAARSE